MYLSEIFDAIVIRSGQFILSNDDIELNQNRFLTLVRLALGKYSGYRPHDVTFPLEMQSNRKFTFDKTFQPKYSDIELGVPLGISSVTPTAVAGSPAFNLQFSNTFGFTGYGGRPASMNHTSVDPNFGLPGQRQVGSEQMEKSNFPWIYQHKTLYIPYSADVEVIAFFNHPIINIEADSSNAEKWELPTIEYNENTLFDLLQGMFLKAIGNSRKAFTLNDLPLTMDGVEIASEGQSLEEAAMAELKNDKAKFYLAYGD